MNKITNSDFAILIISCDRYADMWSPFFNFLNLYWPDCPYKIYLSTNFKSPQIENVNVLNSDLNGDWSAELLINLKKIPEKNIIMFLEDYFLREKVNNNNLKYYLDYFLNRKPAYMRLGCFGSKYNEIWPYKLAEDSKLIGVIEKNAKYLICTQVTVWEKVFLENLLIEGESPWQFEIEGSKRASNSNREFLCVKENKWKFNVHGPIVYLCGAVTQGVLMRDAIRMAKRENFEIDLIARPIETPAQEILRRIRIALPMAIRHSLDFVKSRINKKSRN